MHRVNVDENIYKPKWPVGNLKPDIMGMAANQIWSLYPSIASTSNQSPW